MDIKEFLKMDDDELRKKFEVVIGTCLYTKCGKAVMSSDEKRYVPRGVYHEDCYFAEWGDEVEQYPICTPGRKGIRGCS